MALISKLVRDTIRERLADPAAGWNITHAALATAAGVPAIAIDFSGTGAKQFFEGQVDVDDVLGSTAAKRPVMQIFTRASANTNACLRGIFSGTIEAYLLLHIEQRSGNAVRDYETPADVVEGVFYRLFMDRAWQKPSEVTFGGEISVTRGPVIAGDANWRQTITCRLICGTHVAE